MLLYWVYLLLGIALLYAGAEFLVRGAAGIARGFDVRPAVIGLTLIAFGTSMPEMTVTILASARGASDICLGNIIGSNIANIGLVIGVAAMIRPLKVERKLVLREVPVAIFAAVVFLLMSIDGSISRADGATLVLFMAAFIVFTVVKTLRERGQNGAGGLPGISKVMGLNILMAVAGIVVIVGGGHLFLKMAVFIAGNYGISELFIGITLVALGTSLPELATSAVAAYRREHDLCISNVVGSNIINIFCGIGLAALVSPIAVDPGLLTNQFLFLIGFSLALLPLLIRGLGISRLEGLICLLAYFAFVFFAYVK